jgi:DNA-directed RNA polymerase specialized sigma24 family protein
MSRARIKPNINALASRVTIFATTHWSVVLAAGGEPSPAAREALERLCSAYWYPLYAHVRTKGFSPSDAEDLTQEFFARFLASDALRDVSREQGRFRAFLLASINHFLANEWDRLRAQKRGGGRSPLSLDAFSAEQRLQTEPATHLTPERLYERRWASILLETVLGRLRAEMIAAGKRSVFEFLRGFLSDAAGTLPYREAATQLGLTEPATRKAVQRLRQRYRELLREEVAHTVAAPHEVESELRSLLSAFTT